MSRKLTRKMATEESLQIRVKDFSQFQDVLGKEIRGNILYNETFQKGASFELYFSENWASLLVFYQFRKFKNEEKKMIKNPILLYPQDCNFGGRRWFFECPNAKCRKRVTALYFGKGPGFSCRMCKRLTYFSVRHHDNRIGRLIRNPELLKERIKRPYGWKDRMLTFRALAKFEDFWRKRIQTASSFS